MHHRVTARFPTFPRARRGVSPIIAIILLVAITVVLAAVLYVLIAPLSHASNSAPLGTALALGPANEFVGTKATNSFCATSHPCYEVDIQFASTSLTLGSVGLALKASSGATQVVTANSAKISVVTSSDAPIAYTTIAKNQLLETTVWKTFSKGYSSGTPISDSMFFCIQFGNTKLDPLNQGFSLQVSGSGSYSGLVVYQLP